MAKLALKVLATILIVVLSAGFLAGLFETSGLAIGLLGVGILISFLLLIYGVIPRWLVVLAWSILAFYFLFLVNPPPTTDPVALLSDIRFLIPLALFALFVAFLTKWVSDVRAVRRWSRRLDEETRTKVEDIQTGLVEGETGVFRPSQTEAGTPVTDVRTLESMKDLLGVEKILDSGEQRAAAISKIHGVIVRMADDSRRSARRSTVMGVVTFVLGVGIGYSSEIYAWLAVVWPF